MFNFSDSQIQQSLVGPLITIDIVKTILEDREVFVNGAIDTERFSLLYHEILDYKMPLAKRENADWACGYLTADNLNHIINAD